jgi:hypothetical protein
MLQAPMAKQNKTKQNKTKQPKDSSNANNITDPLDTCGIDFGDATYTNFVQHMSTLFLKSGNQMLWSFCESHRANCFAMFKTQFLVQYKMLANLLKFGAHFEAQGLRASSSLL